MKKASVILAALIAAMPLAADNPKPFTVPEVRQWVAASGISFTPGAETRIVCRDKAMLQAAEALADGYAELTGVRLEVVTGKPAKGDISFAGGGKTARKTPEGYAIEITPEGVAVKANDEAGAHWAAQTILQLTETSPALPCGRITDWPDYRFRGFMLDCGRKYIPIDYLYKLVDVLAHYKMNILQIHLNDNGFKYFYDDDWDKTQAAFRLESERFPQLTARDGSYTKEEFKALQRYALKKGVEIVPEIDFPAHSLAFTRLKPEIGSTDDEYGRDHLDLMKPETYEFLDSLLEEYIGGDDPVFIGPRFHIGTDEYSNRDSVVVEKFRYLTDRYIRFTESHGKRPVVWGALTHARGTTPVKSEGVEMYCWYNGYAEPDSMLSLGYDLVSVPDGWVYIVPAAGYYHDYLDNRRIYEKWSPAQIGSKRIDPASPQLMGGMFAVWNDHPGNGITVRDIHHRIMEALPAMAAKNWAGDNVTVPFERFDSLRRNLAEAPGVNYLARHKAGADGMVLSRGAVNPGTVLPIAEVGYPYRVEFDLEADDEKPGTALFHTPEATFWLSDPISGRMGFSREGELRTFRFNTVKGEKSHIVVEGDHEGTRLWVNGRLIDNLSRRRVSYNGSDRKMAIVSTLVFPLAETGSFNSRITNLQVRQKAE